MGMRRIGFVLSLFIGCVWAQPGMGPRRVGLGGPPQFVEGTGKVEGTVAHRRTGEPVARAMVYLTKTDGSQGLSVMAGADGKFVFEKVARGVYRVSAERRGFLRGEYGTRRYGQRGGLITLTDGQEMKGADVKLDPQSVIAGQILDDNGEPLQNVQVVAWKRIPAAGRQGGPAGNDSTDDRGEFRIAGLGPGKYYLQATVFRREIGLARNMRWADGGEPETYVSTYFPGTTEVTSATAVELGVGQEFLGLSMQVKKARVFRVKGTVQGGDPTGMRVMAVNRSVQAGFTGPGMNAMVGRDGSFELAGVTPGSYTVMAMRGGGPGGTGGAAKAIVEVGSADVEGVQLMFGATLTVQGSVRAEGGGAAELGNLRIYLMNEELSFASPSGRVNADGTFSIEGVAPDRYRLTTIYMGRGYYVKSATMGGQDVKGKMLDFSAGAAGRIEVMLGSKTASVSGTVSKAAPESLPGMVVLVPEGAGAERVNFGPVSRWESAVDQNGAFHLDNVPPGEYRAFAFEEFDANEMYEEEFLKKVEGAGEKVRLGEGETKTVSLKQVPGGEGLL